MAKKQQGHNTRRFILSNRKNNDGRRALQTLHFLPAPRNQREYCANTTLFLLVATPWLRRNHEHTLGR